MFNRDTALKVCFTVLVLLFLWIIYQADMGKNQDVFIFLDQIKYGDKFAHFLFFGVASLLLNLILKLKCIQVLGIRLYIGSCAVLLFSTLEEMSQILTPHRNFDTADLMANIAGVLTFALVSYFIPRSKAKLASDNAK